MKHGIIVVITLVGLSLVGIMTFAGLARIVDYYMEREMKKKCPRNIEIMIFTPIV